MVDGVQSWPATAAPAQLLGEGFGATCLLLGVLARLVQTHSDGEPGKRGERPSLCASLTFIVADDALRPWRNIGVTCCRRPPSYLCIMPWCPSRGKQEVAGEDSVQKSVGALTSCKTGFTFGDCLIDLSPRGASLFFRCRKGGFFLRI